jgi:hypothetical protein
MALLPSARLGANDLEEEKLRSRMRVKKATAPVMRMVFGIQLIGCVVFSMRLQ